MAKKDITDSRVTLYPDGKYRWVYEVPMLKNPSILFDVYWVLGISFGLVWLLNVIFISCEDGFSLESLWGFSSGLLILMLVFAAGNTWCSSRSTRRRWYTSRCPVR